MDPDDDGTPGKRPPAPSETSRQPMTLLLRTTRSQACIEGLDSDISDDNDYAVVDPETDERVGRIYLETFLAEPRWLWFLQTVPAPPPNSGKEDTLEEVKAAFKRRYGEAKGRT